MGDSRYARCKGCGKTSAEVGTALSWTRLCPECGAVNLRENVAGLVEHRGPAFARWRRGMAACIGLALDDARDAT